MAHPQKHSRRITVGGQFYRWRIVINDDYPWIKSIAIYGEDVLNGGELRLQTEALSITPALIHRAILLGLGLGFDPAVKASSQHLSPQQVEEVVHVYPRQLEAAGRPFVWLPDFKGGLHMKIRSARCPEGQLLATMSTLEPDHLTDEIAALFIEAGLAAGWQPELSQGDCVWLAKEVGDEIIRAVSRIAKTAGNPPFDPLRSWPEKPNALLMGDKA